MPYLKYANDPVGYFRDVLKVEPWENPGGGHGPHGQADILRAVAEHDFVACRSGHKVGKTLTAAGLALWHLDTRVDGIVVVTAPTDHLMRKLVDGELRRHVERGGLDIDVPKHPATSVANEDGRRIFCVSPADPDALSMLTANAAFFGHTGSGVFLIVDEAASLVDDKVFEALPFEKLLMVGCPARTEGMFFDAFSSRLFKTLHIDSRDVAQFTDISDLASQAWCERAERAWDVDSSMHAARIRGEFPPSPTKKLY